MSHWKNSRFQYLAFVAGTCHTPDEAYRRIKMEHDDRALALAIAEGTRLKAGARRLELEHQAEHGELTHERLEARGELAIMQAHKPRDVAAIEQARRDCDFLAALLEELAPHRKHAGLPEHEADQLIQREEWLYELLFRAENHFATNGGIPPQELAAMRRHPDFERVIAPELHRMLEESRTIGAITFRPGLLERLGIPPIGPAPELAPLPQASPTTAPGLLPGAVL